MENDAFPVFRLTVARVISQETLRKFMNGKPCRNFLPDQPLPKSITKIEVRCSLISMPYWKSPECSGSTRNAIQPFRIFLTVRNTKSTAICQQTPMKLQDSNEKHVIVAEPHQTGRPFCFHAGKRKRHDSLLPQKFQNREKPIFPHRKLNETYL